ncbi:MAG: hypothetical protein CFH21_00228 [Alphaproteobacteria bacterium MarineAlpha5_Bin11]|nr:hypothetical protein [Pelagibacteraceae bacterium]PPR44704.1 MAG: hypothetical protein CFH21_00228 [Alphaproteobacteria bacterium MarineAlpha5_Bin11]
MYKNYNKSKISILLILFGILPYLFLGTGIHGDDISQIKITQNIDFEYFLNPDPKIRGISSFFLPGYYFFWWAYPVFGYEHQWPYDLIKYIVHLISLFLIFRFLSDYIPRNRAFFGSLIFLFYPAHESTAYWYMIIPYVLSPALIMYSHHLMRLNQKYKSLMIGTIASFITYSSVPYIFGLSIIFIYERYYKKFIFFILPGILYLTYYFIIGYLFPVQEQRINDNLTIVGFIKNIIIQIISSFDSLFGPSFFIKIYLSITSISVISLIISFLIIFIFRNIVNSKIKFIPWSLIFGVLSVLLFSYCMFALTGLYTQSSFNLGNRVTIYGSLIMAVLISLLPFNNKFLLFVSLIFIFPVLGISDHWKTWNEKQKILINNIENNKDLALIEDDNILLIKGNFYSKLGPISHIEFLSMPWVAKSIFEKSVKTEKIMPLTSYVITKDGNLIDNKFKEQFLITYPIYLYDTNTNILKKLNKIELENIMTNRDREIRHWVQIIDNKNIISFITYLNPRLEYLFKK